MKTALTREQLEVSSFVQRTFPEAQLRSKGNIAVKCPFCKHHKLKLEVKLDTGIWHCWVCNSRGGSLKSLLQRAGYTPLIVSEAKQLPFKNKPKIKEFKEKPNFKLPNGFIPLTEQSDDFYGRKAYNYLVNKRGLTYGDIVKYDIGYVSEGELHGYIVIPNYDYDGVLNYYTTRSYLPSKQSFKNPPLDRDIIGFELQLNWNMPIVVVESALNAITGAVNTTPMYGKFMTQALIEGVFENDVKDIIIALDPDAKKQSAEYINQFKNAGKEVYYIDFPDGKDLNEMGRDWFLDKLNNLKRVDSSQALKMLLESHFR